MAKQRMSIAETKVISDSPCFLDRIIINGGTLGNISIYDDITANVESLIGILDAANATTWVFPYKVVCETGLTIVTDAATDILVISYRRDIDGGVPSSS